MRSHPSRYWVIAILGLFGLFHGFKMLTVFNFIARNYTKVRSGIAGLIIIILLKLIFHRLRE